MLKVTHNYINNDMTLMCIRCTKNYALFLRLNDMTYIVADYYIEYPYNFITWGMGHYFDDDLKSAVDFFFKKTNSEET